MDDFAKFLESKPVQILLWSLLILLVIISLYSIFTGQSGFSQIRQFEGGGRIYDTNRKTQISGLYNSNGKPIVGNPNLKQKTCSETCLDLGATGTPHWSVVQDPKGSKYYPAYRCWCHMGAA